MYALWLALAAVGLAVFVCAIIAGIEYVKHYFDREIPME